jgi:hypothetical protein
MEKEIRVYVLEAGLINISAYDIENWNLYQEQHKKLLPEAENFITLCESRGNVYTLHGFMQAFNLEETINLGSYVFFTNNY